ncbi:MAG: zinc ribbon domain-containing protein [Thermoplasmata archaeon]
MKYRKREIQKYGTTEVSQSVEKVVEAHNQAISAITSAEWEISNAKKANLDTKQAEEKLEKAKKALNGRDYEHAKMFAMDAEIIIRDMKSKQAVKEQKKQTQAIITGRVAPTCPSCGKIVSKSWKMCFFCKSKL